jgi:hypothetical protein
MTTTETRILWREAARRAVDWLAARIGPDGLPRRGLRGPLLRFYKLPCLMQLAGRPTEAQRLLD